MSKFYTSISLSNHMRKRQMPRDVNGLVLIWVHSGSGTRTINEKMELKLKS